jgi:hypothetical protein
MIELAEMCVGSSMLPILAIDDLDDIGSHVDFLPEQLRTDLIRALHDLVTRGRLKLLATLSNDIMLDLKVHPAGLGREQINYRGQFINLSPTQSHLLQARGGISPQVLSLFANVSDREYLPGEGTLVVRGHRREVHLHRTELAVELTDKYFAELDGDEL